MTIGPTWSQHDRWIDVHDGDQMLDFVYEYLRKLACAPTDAAVREITSILARCKARVVPYAVLEDAVTQGLAARAAPALD